MTQHYETLGRLSEVFQVHPRTILRAITGKRNAPWSEDELDEEILLQQVANAYDMRLQSLRAVLEGRDKLINTAEAARLLRIPDRTLRHRIQRGHLKRIKCGRVVRFLKSKVIEHKIATE